MNFEIWVDADSVPKNIRPVILKAAVRINTAAYFVADRELADVKQFIADDTHRIRTENNDRSLKSSIHMVVVQSRQNSADDRIVENAPVSSLCITHDIPLAARLLEKGCRVINDRGDTYTSENIKSMLKDREVNSALREMGVFAEQQSKQGNSNLKLFSDNFDRTVTAMLKEIK